MTEENVNKNLLKKVMQNSPFLSPLLQDFYAFFILKLYDLSPF